MGDGAAQIELVRVLGPIQAVTADGRSFDLPSVSQRRLLALLAVHAPRSLRVDLLCDALGISPGALRTTVSRLRKALGDGAILASQSGYRLAVAVDAHRFTATLSEVVSSDDRIGAIERALAFWAGPPFDEFASDAWASPEVARLTELHASATEDHAVELMAALRWSEAIAELQAHVATNPLRDRPRGLLIQALAGAGRQADALRAFQDYRTYLAQSVGTEPSAEVRRIEQSVASGQDTLAEVTPPAPAWPRSQWLPLHGELANGPTLIGRVRELDLLTSDLALVGVSGPRIVIVEGEAGIGKTTLLGAFARAVRDRDSATVLYGRCQDGPAAPLQPFRSLLDNLVEHAPMDVLEAHTARHGGRLERIAPRLGERIEVPKTEASDDGAERQLLFEAVGDMVARLARMKPLVVLLDDLQWAEPTALHLLRHLGATLVDEPVLLVLSARDSDERPLTLLRSVFADLQRRPSRSISLHGFDDQELADLMASLVALDRRTVAPALSARLQDDTAGNPLYAAQLVRHWAESGSLLLAATEVELVDNDSAGDVPASLRNLLWSRVNALGDNVLQVLSAAAVLGSEFSEDAVIDMVGISAHDAMDALDAAELAGLLLDVGPPAGTMRFVHVLVANAVYSELPGRRRRRLHAEAACVLEKHFDAPTVHLAAQLAQHCALGGLSADAQRWARVAGDHAAEQLSPSEAVRWYRMALDQASMLQIPDSERADLLVRLGRAEQQANEHGAMVTLSEAADLARRCGAPAVVVQAALATDRGFLRLGAVAPAQIAIVESALEVVGDDVMTRARLLALLAEDLTSEPAAGTRRIELAVEAVALADSSSDPTFIARICSSVLYALWGPSPEAARLRPDVATRSIAAAEASGDRHLEFGVHAAAYTVAIQIADPIGAARSLQRLHAIAEEFGAPHMTWTVGYFEAFVATMEARFVDAEQLGRETMEFAMAMDSADGITVFAGQAAVLATIAGHLSELPPLVAHTIEAGPVHPTFRLAHAIISVGTGPKEVASDLLDEAVSTRFGHVPPDVLWMTTMLGYAVLAVELEDLEAAALLLPIIEPFAGEVATNLGPVAAYVGRLASLLGRHLVAEQHLEAALGIADAFGWDYYRATTQIALASCRLRHLGKLDALALDELAAAERICTAQGLPNLLATIADIRG